MARPTTIRSEIMLATIEVSTCAHNTPDRAIGSDWKRSKMPLCTLGAVVSACGDNSCLLPAVPAVGGPDERVECLGVDTDGDQSGLGAGNGAEF